MKLVAKWIYFSVVVLFSFLMAFRLAGFNWQQIISIVFFVLGSFFAFWGLFIVNWDDVLKKKETKDDKKEG